ncbi:MAG: NAD-dependent deacylase [Betaproteobacteria bacterium]|nr:NAD-dependent deacylase [Betaproteobacteria bacterium]
MIAIADDLARALRSARFVAVLSGAGVSAESGVSTFRDALTGLWANFDPLELATPSAFRRNPKLVWDWYAERRAQLARVLPNPGHHAIARIEASVPRFLLATQNVDGLHARAGSRRLVELHGNIARVRCSEDPRHAVEAWDDVGDEPPRCAHCGAYLRPDVVWFEESLPAQALCAAEAAARACDLLIVAGTSGEVYPAAALPQYAKAAGAIVLEVNPAATPLSARADYALRFPSGEALPALVRAAWGEDAMAGQPSCAESSREGGNGAR